MSRARLAFAVDAASWREAAPLVEQVAPHVDVLKLGLELFCAEGPAAVREARSLGPEIFLDLKLHDIPATVERSIAAVAGLGIRYVTVHASGGRAMVRSAVARARRDAPELEVLAVTALTSLGDADLDELGVARGMLGHVSALAALAWEAGARGFVCSPREVAELRARFPDATLVTPGIRRASDPAGDQARTMTPAEAAARGASLLVVGRPIRDAEDPAAVAREIKGQLA